MQTNALSPAYPITPLQDNFGRMVVPVAGLSKLEHFTLEIFKSYVNNEIEIGFAEGSMNEQKSKLKQDLSHYIMDSAIKDAVLLLYKIEEKHKNILNEKDTVLDII
jgi:hypothetical protein